MQFGNNKTYLAVHYTKQIESVSIMWSGLKQTHFGHLCHWKCSSTEAEHYGPHSCYLYLYKQG